MGSSISVVIAELCRGVKHRNKIMQAPPCMPIMWRRYVDDCLAILRYEQEQGFLNHINGIDVIYNLK